MKKLIVNPFFQKGFPTENGKDPVSTDVEAVRKLLAMCPVAAETPLVTSDTLARNLGINKLWLKDERNRMGLGSFKALGATFVIASHAANNVAKEKTDDDWKKSLSEETYVSASAGNHGLSLAAGARIFGANAVIYLSVSVPKGFVSNLKSYGARVVIEGEDYESSMDAAERDADLNGWELLSDVTWDGYEGGIDVMEGYLVMAYEATKQWEGEIPTHVFLQTGCGGLSAAVSAKLRKIWGQNFKICTVEPSAAPAIKESIIQGKPVHTSGPVSNMGRLDCKAPSHAALKYLALEADYLMTLEDEFVSEEIKFLDKFDLQTSPSGGAGFAGLIYCLKNSLLDVNDQSRVLIFISEGPSDD